MLPVAFGVASLLGGAFLGARKNKLSPTHQIVYETAIRGHFPADQLRGLADKFDEQGFSAHAGMLRKRADIRELPKSVRDARKSAFQAGLNCKDPAQVLQLAQKFEDEAYFGYADKLRKYAAALKV